MNEFGDTLKVQLTGELPLTLYVNGREMVTTWDGVMGRDSQAVKLAGHWLVTITGLPSATYLPDGTP